MNIHKKDQKTPSVLYSQIQIQLGKFVLLLSKNKAQQEV